VHGTAISQKVCLPAWTGWQRTAWRGTDGRRRHKIGYMSFCIKSGTRGQGDLSKIQIVGPPIKNFAKTYQTAQHLAADHQLAAADAGKLSWNEEQDTGRRGHGLLRLGCTPCMNDILGVEVPFTS